MLWKIKNILRRSMFYDIYKWAQSKFAKLYFQNPSSKLIVIWVTWTDGKSTTCNVIHKILNDNLWKTALFTTVNQKFGSIERANTAKMTNVSAWKTQEFLAQAVENGCKYCVLEVSSHGIDQKRVANIEYDVAVLTNITEEHLDYHKNIRDYANTKKKLFQWVIRNRKWLGIWILNKDDDFGKKWAEELAFKKTITYWLHSNAEIRAENIEQFVEHTEFELKYLNQEYKVNTKLLWTFNIYNILAAISSALWLKVDLEKAIKSVEQIEPIKWRMNYYQDKKWTHYFIDYAHTPAALNAVLRYLKDVAPDNRIITVFGAPGVRDQQKRPKMWQVVSQFSDIVILTDDDPDTEPRMQIIDQVAKWIKRKQWDDFWIVPDRELAIKLAYDLSKKDDIVLIAWKGHETVQLTNLWKRHYSDVETLKTLIKNDWELPL